MTFSSIYPDEIPVEQPHTTTAWICIHGWWSRLSDMRHPELTELLGKLKRHLKALQWRHNGRNGISNHQPRDCLLNRLFRRWPVNSPHKGPERGKCFHLMTSSWHKVLQLYPCALYKLRFRFTRFIQHNSTCNVLLLFTLIMQVPVDIKSWLTDAFDQNVRCLAFISSHFIIF